MPPRCVVAASLADTATAASRQPEQLRVEPAAAGVLVAGTGWERDGARQSRAFCSLSPVFSHCPQEIHWGFNGKETAWGYRLKPGSQNLFILVFKMGAREPGKPKGTDEPRRCEARGLKEWGLWAWATESDPTCSCPTVFLGRMTSPFGSSASFAVK